MPAFPKRVEGINVGSISLNFFIKAGNSICFLYFTRVDPIDVSDTSLESENTSIGFAFGF